MLKMDHPRERSTSMLHAYRLVYRLSEHAPPQLWEYEQPYIDNLVQNARTFARFVTPWYFEDWAAFDRDNTRIWETYYRPKLLFDHCPTWQDWLPEYRQLLSEVQTIVHAHTAQGTWHTSRSRLRRHEGVIGSA